MRSIGGGSDDEYILYSRVISAGFNVFLLSIDVRAWQACGYPEALFRAIVIGVTSCPLKP